MSRTLSTAALRSAFSQETGEVWAVLLIINHVMLSQPIRVTNNNENIVSGGFEYISLAFDVEFPGEDREEPSRARLTMDNISPIIVDTLRSIATPPSVRIRVVLASQPNVIEADFDGLILRNVEYDAGAVSGDLNFEHILSEPVSRIITPANFPGLF